MDSSGVGGGGWLSSGPQCTLAFPHGLGWKFLRIVNLLTDFMDLSQPVKVLTL